ncbi:hypothetical protein Pelo_4545 [Pelomyxa schiedti]|nr:hypothetical protein Pelo_4545 [Pelomyxa schiedti]
MIVFFQASHLELYTIVSVLRVQLASLVSSLPDSLLYKLAIHPGNEHLLVELVRGWGADHSLIPPQCPYDHLKCQTSLVDGKCYSYTLATQVPINPYEIFLCCFSTANTAASASFSVIWYNFAIGFGLCQGSRVRNADKTLTSGSEPPKLSSISSMRVIEHPRDWESILAIGAAEPVSIECCNIAWFHIQSTYQILLLVHISSLWPGQIFSPHSSTLTTSNNSPGCNPTGRVTAIAIVIEPGLVSLANIEPESILRVTIKSGEVP